METLAENVERARNKLERNPKKIHELEQLGNERKLVYLVYLYTGMRLSELSSITMSQVDWADNRVRLYLDAPDAKNRTEHTFELPEHISEHLRTWIEVRRKVSNNGASTTTALFQIPRHLVKILDRDLAVAGIAKIDERRSIDRRSCFPSYVLYLGTRSRDCAS